jgi:2-dehydropantoate 2-reductase
MAKRSYAVIGLGAVGGYYGAKLAAAGHPVHFVVRSDLDLDHVREHGLRVESPDGDLVFDDVSVHGSAASVPPVDTVVVAVKATDTEGTLDTVATLAARGAIVVAMQNGLGVEAVLAEAAPGATVLGAMCFLCSNKVGPGHVRHLDYGRVTVGAHGDSVEERVARTADVVGLVDDLRGAGVKAEALDDLEAGRWRKLVWNVPYNGLSVVLDAGTDELMAHSSTRSLVEALMGEVLEGAAACGQPIEAGFVDQMLADTEAMTPYATSMKLDYDAGRPLELDAIYATPLAAAHAAGCRLPRIEALHDELRFLDERNRGVSPGDGTTPATRP